MTQAPLQDNPVLAAWSEAFGLPPFSGIATEHFRPAFDAALAANKAEIERIAGNPAAPTFENTIEALERGGEALTRVSDLFFVLAGANTNDALEAVERDVSPLLARHDSEIYLNVALFHRIDVLYRQRDTLGLNDEQRRVLERYHLRFVREGARLDPAAKKRFAEIDEKLASLGTQFGQNVLADEKSQYQQIKIFDTIANGRVMVLDDIVQITTRDESAYAEMLTHLPLLEHGKGTRVMIVGGGDLSIADEALKHKGVKEVVLVDIDGRVVELCRKHFGALNARAFKDKRLKIEIADAFEYLGRPEAKARFDLIVADRPDPVGPGKALFGDHFYDRVRGALKPSGFATFQTGVPFYQPWEITDALRELAQFFPQSGLYLTVVPTYIGGFMALSWAGMSKPLGTPAGIRRAAKRFANAKLKTDYYNPEIHAAAFAFPEWIKRLQPKKRRR